MNDDPYDYLDADYEEYLRKEGKMMDSQEFIDKCKEIVSNYANKHLDKSDQKKLPKRCFVVWSCKTLQNNKALLSTTLLDGMYYELTLNGDKQEIYFDAYKNGKIRQLKSNKR